VSEAKYNLSLTSTYVVVVYAINTNKSWQKNNYIQCRINVALKYVVRLDSTVLSY